MLRATRVCVWVWDVNLTEKTSKKFLEPNFLALQSGLQVFRVPLLVSWDYDFLGEMIQFDPM